MTLKGKVECGEFSVSSQGILERLDSREVVVGDGGFLFTLEKRGFVKAGLWTPEAVVEHPSAGECPHHPEVCLQVTVSSTTSERKSRNNSKYFLRTAFLAKLPRGEGYGSVWTETQGKLSFHPPPFPPLSQFLCLFLSLPRSFHPSLSLCLSLSTLIFS